MEKYRLLFTIPTSLRILYREFTDSHTYSTFLDALLRAPEVDFVGIISRSGKKTLRKGIETLCPFLESGQGPFAPKRA
ncbi:MAG: hypothetical protein HGA67_02620 [Candidatus Yonathbacteria bacterium]|nr:hypothetical protein [Candidatus Yonathbacteria bacterium]